MVLLTVLAYDRLIPEPNPTPQDIITAYNAGSKDALKTNPPSLSLEAVCMELWANKK
jgi:hypothetical protein